MFRFLRCLLLCPLLLLKIAPALLAQLPLARARQSSFLTKVFRLTDAQARRLYKRGLAAAGPEFFIQLVDSFPTDSAATARAWRPLPRGYYLVAHTEGPELVYWLRSETDRQLRPLTNE